MALIATFKLPTTNVRGSKALFFDRDAVISRLDKVERKFLSGVGAFIRSDARRSMRRVKSGRPSKPGKPPRVKVGFIKDFLFFVYNAREHSVIVGPARLSGVHPTKIPVPGLHEHGGTQALVGGGFSKYPARPYMRPAFDKNTTPAVLDRLKNSIVQ